MTIVWSGDLFVCCFFVCFYRTRKSLLRLPPSEGSKPPGSISIRTAWLPLTVLPKIQHRPETLYVPTGVNTLQVCRCCYAATQLALQVQQERTQVVCSNKEARKCLAQALPRWTLNTWTRVAKPKGEALPRRPMEDFGKWYPMVAAKRSAGTTDGRSDMVYALEHRFCGRCIWTPQHYETNLLSASQLPAPRFSAPASRTLFKKDVSPRALGENIHHQSRPKSSLGIFFGMTKESLALRPTQSIIYVHLQENWFQKSILLIVQYKYLNSYSGDFILQNLIIPTRSCGTGVITPSSWGL